MSRSACRRGFRVIPRRGWSADYLGRSASRRATAALACRTCSAVSGGWRRGVPSGASEVTRRSRCRSQASGETVAVASITPRNDQNSTTTSSYTRSARTAPASWARVNSARPAVSIRSRTSPGWSFHRRVRQPTCSNWSHPTARRYSTNPSAGDSFSRAAVGGRKYRLEDLGDHCLDEQLLGGEPPVQGADADAGPLGDDLDPDIHAVLVEGRPGGGEDLVTVARRVATQRGDRRERGRCPRLRARPKGGVRGWAWWSSFRNGAPGHQRQFGMFDVDLVRLVLAGRESWPTSG